MLPRATWGEGPGLVRRQRGEREDGGPGPSVELKAS